MINKKKIGTWGFLFLIHVDNFFIGIYGIYRMRILVYRCINLPLVTSSVLLKESYLNVLLEFLSSQEEDGQHDTWPR